MTDAEFWAIAAERWADSILPMLLRVHEQDPSHPVVRSTIAGLQIDLQKMAQAFRKLERPAT